MSESEILDGHLQSTKSRFNATCGPILVLHDTTEIAYKRLEPQKIGYNRECGNRKSLFDQDIKRA